MGHIDVKSKSSDKKYLDKIWLDNEHTIYININNGLYEDITDGKGVRRLRLTDGYVIMLTELIIENNNFVANGTLYEMIYPEDKNYEETCDSIKKKIKNSIYNSFYSKDFIKKARAHGLIICEEVSSDGMDDGYRLILPEQGDNLTEEFDVCEDPILPVMTNTNVVYVNEKNIIYREQFISEIEDALVRGEKCINICGFGGLGKTSVAQMIYFHFAPKNYRPENAMKCGELIYDHIGFIPYSGNIKNSIMSAIPYLYSKEDAGRRWQLLARRLKNDKSRKLMIFDNVDRNETVGQNPLSLEDRKSLEEISGWPNADIILTSRIEEIPGFISHNIETLGNDDNPGPCIDLFCHYNDQFTYDKDTIGKIVRKCGYNTYAIEILARSSKRQSSLKKFYNNICRKGFDFPNARFQTAYCDYNATAAEQLMRLFDITHLSSDDIGILRCFALLPDMENITQEELDRWFGYTDSDISHLISEGWIQCNSGIYHIHPLVREAILLQLPDKKISDPNRLEIINLIIEGAFFETESDFYDRCRKTAIAVSLIEHIDMTGNSKLMLLPLQTADAARKLNQRSYAIHMYETACREFDRHEDALSEDELSKYWKAKYFLGYMLSYTSGKIDVSLKYLSESLTIARKLMKSGNTRKNSEHLATNLDHLGYVLSANENTYEKAEEYYRRALAIRKLLNEEYPGEYDHEYAWSCDNLGYMLSFNRHTADESLKLLNTALKIRKNLANGKASDEVAWTLSNLSNLYFSGAMDYDTAAGLLDEALFEYNELNYYAPGKYYATMASIMNNYGVMLTDIHERSRDAIDKLRNSLSYYESLEENEAGSYWVEIALVCSNIAGSLFLAECDDNEEIVRLYERAISLLDPDDAGRMSTTASSKYGNNAETLGDIYYSYWLFLKYMNIDQVKWRNCKNRAFDLWNNTPAGKDECIKTIIENHSGQSIMSEDVADLTVILYIQGGARKKRIMKQLPKQKNRYYSDGKNKH